MTNLLKAMMMVGTLREMADAIDRSGDPDGLLTKSSRDLRARLDEMANQDARADREAMVALVDASLGEALKAIDGRVAARIARAEAAMEKRQDALDATIAKALGLQDGLPAAAAAAFEATARAVLAPVAEALDKRVDAVDAAISKALGLQDAIERSQESLPAVRDELLKGLADVVTTLKAVQLPQVHLNVPEGLVRVDVPERKVDIHVAAAEGPDQIDREIEYDASGRPKRSTERRRRRPAGAAN